MTNEERLRALLAEAHSFVDPTEGNLFDRIHAALAEPVSNDFKRGAEAMREAALKECGYWQGADRCADQIRALPIPEDK